MTLARFLRAVFLAVTLLVATPARALPPADAVVTAFGYTLTPPAFAALERRLDVLVTVARAYQIDADRLLAVCFVESGLAIRRPRAILCGCGYRVAGDRAQAECAALALLIGHKRCGTWRMSHARYQSGRCVPATPVTRRYVRAVTWALVAIRAASLRDDGAESLLLSRGAR